MGTGSHRPQWEAAKGREDARSGIKHARSLPSHTQLKYRQAARPAAAPLRARIEPARRSFADAASAAEQPGTGQVARSDVRGSPVEANSDADAGRDSGSDSESDDSEAELRRELDLINKRRALQAQRDAQRKPAPAPASKWRSEATFKRTRPMKKRGTDMINDTLKKAEHHDFLDKYLK